MTRENFSITQHTQDFKNIIMDKILENYRAKTKQSTEIQRQKHLSNARFLTVTPLQPEKNRMSSLKFLKWVTTNYKKYLLLLMKYKDIEDKNLEDCDSFNHESTKEINFIEEVHEQERTRKESIKYNIVKQ